MRILQIFRLAQKVPEVLCPEATKFIQTARGTNLAQKICGKEIKSAEKVFGFCIPKGAQKYNYVRVLTDHGKTQKDIITLTDKTGKPIKRVMRTYDLTTSKPVQFIESDYDRTGGLGIKRNIFDGEMKPKRIIDESFESTNDGFSHIKLKADFTPHGRSEVQTIEDLAPKSKKYIISEAFRDKTGKVKVTSIKSNFCKDPEKLLKYEYFPMLQYRFKDFLRSIIPNAIKRQKVKSKIKFRTRELPDNLYGYYQDGKIVMNTSKNSKGEVVNTINHELRHAYQREHDYLGLLPNIFLDKPLNMEERKLLLKRFFSSFKGIPATIMQSVGNTVKKIKPKQGSEIYRRGYNLYYNQLIERDARKAGALAEKEYTEMANELRKIFPNVSNIRFGASLNHIDQDILMNIIKEAEKNGKVIHLNDLG